MLWKELYIERVGTLGRFGRWLGVLITVSIGGGSLVLAAMIFGRSVLAHDDRLVGLGDRFPDCRLSAPLARDFMGWLLQWAIGLRAAVSIASERERGTWDAALDEPARARRDRASQAVGQHSCPALDGGGVGAGLDTGSLVGAVTPIAITSPGWPPTRWRLPSWPQSVSAARSRYQPRPRP